MWYAYGFRDPVDCCKISYVVKSASGTFTRARATAMKFNKHIFYYRWCRVSIVVVYINLFLSLIDVFLWKKNAWWHTKLTFNYFHQNSRGILLSMDLKQKLNEATCSTFDSNQLTGVKLKRSRTYWPNFVYSN